MLHGMGLYPLRDDSPSVWGLPEVGGRTTPAAADPYQQAVQVISPIVPQPQVVWPTGMCYHSFPLQQPYTIHPIVRSMHHNHAIFPDMQMATYPSAGYSVTNYIGHPLSVPNVVQMAPVVPALARQQNANHDADANIQPVKTVAPTKKEPQKPDMSKFLERHKETTKLSVTKVDEEEALAQSLQHVANLLLKQDDEDEEKQLEAKEKGSGFITAVKKPVGAIGTHLECKSVLNTSYELPGILKKLEVIPVSPKKLLLTRPQRITCKQGLTGTIVHLKANFFPILRAESMKIYKYSVKFTPHIDPRSPAFKAVMQGCQEALGSYVLVDGQLYCTRHLIGNACKLFSQYEKSSYFISLKEERGEKGRDEHVDVLNGLFTALMKSFRLFQAGTAYFSKDLHVKAVSDKLVGWDLKPGYFPKIVNCDGGIFMNLDVVHMAIRPETAFEVYQHVIGRSKNVASVFKSCIVGQHVMTIYNNRVYQVKDVEFPFSPYTIFAFKDGIHTFKDYFESKYGVVIKQKKQPLLIAHVVSDGQISKVYLVPELCRMVGLSADQRKDYFLTRAISEEVAKTPRHEALEICKFMKGLANPTCDKAKAILKEWNFGFSNEMVTFKGRHLPAESPKVVPSGRGHSSSKNLFDWTEDWRSNHMLTCIPIKRWAVLVPAPMVKMTERFVTILQNTCGSLGVSLAAPFIIQLESEEISVFNKELKILFAREKPQIVFCILSNNRDDRYRAIKRTCTIEYGVPSQVVIKKSLDFKYDLPIAKRLAVQINCKVGGTPWSVDVPLRLGMVVGIDICVDCRNKSVCYASIVASYNKDYSKFFSTTFEFRTKDYEQLSNLICEHVTKAVHRFKTFQKSLPAVIVVYRDGVGNRVLPHVVSREVPLLQKWMKEIYRDGGWHLSYVVVSKHCNTKIMCAADSVPQTGTVVDTCITRPERYDFYLMSGQTQKRVPTFTHYNVVFDNTCLNADQLQRLTYKMTHLYFNIKGTVRVPAPLRYASRLVALVGNVLHQPPHLDLSHLLHFL